MKVIINIIKGILIILLTCAIIGLILINIVSSTILNKQYVLEQLDKTNYYEGIQKQLESNFENYIGQSGLDEEVIKNIISVEQVKKDTNIIINNIYDGTSQTINTEQLKSNLKNNIETSLENRNLTVAEQEAIEEYINKIDKQYKETMSHTNYEDNIHQILKKVNQYEKMIKKAIIIAIIVFIILILICNCKKIIKGIVNIGISLFSTGILAVILKMYIDSKIKISNIVILNAAVSTSLRSIINDILSKFINNGYILLGVGLLAIIIGNTVIGIKEEREEQK